MRSTVPRSIDFRLEAVLACPTHQLPLLASETTLRCAHGETYPIVDGIPVLLPQDVEPNHGAFAATQRIASSQLSRDDSFQIRGKDGIDEYVQKAIVETCGILYKSVLGRLIRYPIPEFPLPVGHGEALLDIGCNWGRWTLSATRKGYRVIGVDPSLEALLAARRVASQLGIDTSYVVADARQLPFKSASFQRVFSYSVIQHFSRPDAHQACREIGRVLSAAGIAKVQMATAFGTRNLYHQVRRKFREGQGFEVRYWRTRDLLRMFEDCVGPAALEVDGFFSLNPQTTDLDLLPGHLRAVVRASDFLRRASSSLPLLARCADSVWINTQKRPLFSA